jgi:hypothetical protein
VCRWTPNGTPEYLIDLWGGRATFDQNPLKARITNYCWVFVGDAKQKMNDVKRNCEISGMSVVIVGFHADEGGSWSVGAGPDPI